MTKPTTIHKAAPEGGEHGVGTCVVCGEDVKRVPGGQGPTWMHTHTGMVVGDGGTGYDNYPDHPLAGVPQCVIDGARKALKEAEEDNDVDPDFARAIADAATIETLSALRAAIADPNTRDAVLGKLGLSKAVTCADGHIGIEEA